MQEGLSDGNSPCPHSFTLETSSTHLERPVAPSNLLRSPQGKDGALSRRDCLREHGMAAKLGFKSQGWGVEEKRMEGRKDASDFQHHPPDDEKRS